MLGQGERGGAHSKFAPQEAATRSCSVVTAQVRNINETIYYIASH
jgi:hypothetical protein